LYNESCILTEQADPHVEYEKVKLYPVTIEIACGKLPDTAYRVEKMHNGKIKMNGNSALDWLVERQCVKTDRDSGIVNDANPWAVETMLNASIRWSCLCG
jgi:predicted helicase